MMDGWMMGGIVDSWVYECIGGWVGECADVWMGR